MQRAVSIFAIITALAWPIVVSADDDVMTVDAEPDGYDYLWMVTVTSRTNALDATNVEVNRGNCRTQALGPGLPRSLRYGESVRYRALSCHPIEVVVDVNGKSQLYRFGPQVASGQTFHVSADVHNDLGYRNLLTLTSYVDDVTLKRVTINRGNCGPFGDREVDPPRRMHFGDYYELRSFPCRPVEVTAQTNKGPVTMKLD